MTIAYNNDQELIGILKTDIYELLSKLVKAEEFFMEMSDFDCDHRSDAATLCKMADKAIQQLRS
jgi:hypothetical protein